MERNLSVVWCAHWVENSDESSLVEDLMCNIQNTQRMNIILLKIFFELDMKFNGRAKGNFPGTYNRWVWAKFSAYVSFRSTMQLSSTIPLFVATWLRLFGRLRLERREQFRSDCGNLFCVKWCFKKCNTIGSALLKMDNSKNPAYKAVISRMSAAMKCPGTTNILLVAPTNNACHVSEESLQPGISVFDNTKKVSKNMLPVYRRLWSEKYTPICAHLRETHADMILAAFHVNLRDFLTLFTLCYVYLLDS